MQDTVKSELRTLIGEMIGVAGAVVATADGLLLAATQSPDAEVELDAVAALAAATAAVGNQFSRTLNLGEATGTVIQSGTGCVAVHSLDETAILVLYSTDSSNVARLHLAVLQALPRLRKALAGQPLTR